MQRLESRVGCVRSWERSGSYLARISPLLFHRGIQVARLAKCKGVVATEAGERLSELVSQVVVRDCIVSRVLVR